ncbi:MAG: thioesterase [Elusimicrobia bacterium CG1_02_63_36]|nr:MAG: thioesterase [Elusimicrobia bacterium CG1_02_63_36]PIP83960.1 MAG: thioesterase [Elusimicrobia bacterium CG22_combo_CG10-13_8_21_14_all_63_91]PJA17257.1 MAG: PaaI family thioesterase [Elusimicrobia bacterium CG_4_10_14_0_2_um_filter_63_34]PJB23862.1 MAG: PaaI family thioesterase [Elusimicrobia bacterium CG_4_9_14_3_um_filter_62_55]
MGLASVPERGASIQERYAPKSSCFGCGPANEKGLRIRSFLSGAPDGELVCEWTPEPHHQAFPGMLNGGIAGALLDCHSNWTAAVYLMDRTAADSPPCTVTADFSVRLLRPTPIDGPLRIIARVKESREDRALIEAELLAGGKRTASCLGNFVAVKPGHPAYHRW